MSTILQTPHVGQVECWRQGWPIAFDTETHLIAPGRQLPPMVCMSWAQVVPNAAAVGGMVVGPRGVVTGLEGVELLTYWLENGATMVGANTAFDALVAVVKAPEYMRLLRAWVAAYESGRVRDVFTRQKLLDIAAGCYRGDYDEAGKWHAYGYNLADLCKRHTKRTLSKPADENDHDHWRLRFSELEGVPIAQYPKEAYDYALEDAIGTAEVFIAQEVKRATDKRIKQHFPGRDPFVDEVRQTMAAVPLKAMAAYGLRTDGPSVERLAEEVLAKIEETREDLVAEGLVRLPEYNKSTDAVVAYIRAHDIAHYFMDGDVMKLHKANFVEAWRATQDVNMWRLAYYREMSQDRPAYWEHISALIELGIVEVKHTRDTKAAMERCAKAYESQGLKVPRTDSYDPKTSSPYEYVSLDADACSGSGDPMLEQYSAYSSLAKTVANDIPMLRAGVVMPVHTRYDELIKTGRTSSSKPNVQNVRRLPGIRECFVPRPGFVFIDTDFAMLELHTLAQVCKWMLGFSTLAEALNGGKDPHLIIAAAILNISYDEAKQRKDAGDSEVDNARTAGKGCFHPDTEVLTKDGWVKVGELKMTDLVCSARFEGEKTFLEYAPPLALTERDWDGELVHVQNEGMDLRLTPDHRMVAWHQGSKKKPLNLVTCEPEDMQRMRYWPNAGTLEKELGVVVDDRLLRLAVAVQADGHISKETGQVKLGFTKPRKIERLLSLLREGEYTRATVGKHAVETFRLSSELGSQVCALLDNKRFPTWWTGLAEEGRLAVLDEVEYWDSCGAKTQKPGNKRAGYTYTSTEQQNVEVLQVIATLTNRKTRLLRQERHSPRSAIFQLTIKTKHRSRGGNVQTTRIPYVGKVFCLRTHNDSVVVRDAGIPVITRQCNFGAAGGLSAPTFVVYAWTNYRIRLTLERAQELLRIYHDTWTEIKAYFAWVKGHKDPYSVRLVVDEKTGKERETCRFDIVQPWSQRLRAGASYCEACNSPFQGLGADVAKMALWLVWKATMGLSELGEADPLFGCRMVNFVHDSIMTEVPEARAHAAAMRQKELMERAGAAVLPDVPVKSDAQCSRQWSKKAQQWREPCTACGSKLKCKCSDWNARKLIPWDLRIACREALEGYTKKSLPDQCTTLAEMREGKDKWKALTLGEQAERVAAVAELATNDRAFEYLKRKEWPRDVAREAVTNMFGSERVAA